MFVQDGIQDETRTGNVTGCKRRIIPVDDTKLPRKQKKKAEQDLVKIRQSIDETIEFVLAGGDLPVQTDLTDHSYARLVPKNLAGM